MRTMLLLCVGCTTAVASPPLVAPLGGAVPVVIDTSPLGAPCTHPVPTATTPTWDGIPYDPIAINPDCCPPGYSPVGLDVAGSVVCLVLP